MKKYENTARRAGRFATLLVLATLAINAFALFALASCKLPYATGSFTAGETMWLSDDGARMPILLRGRSESDTVILIVHGGPGASSIKWSMIDDSSFRMLESEFALAYWDQRGSGGSWGNVPESSLTMAQFVSDLELAVDTLRLRFPSKKIAVFGHSFGGALTAAYLQDPARQAKVSSWIMMDGAYSYPRAMTLERQWTLDFANARIAGGVDAAYWTVARDWLEANPDARLDSADAGTKQRITEYFWKTNPYYSTADAEALDQSGSAWGMQMTLFSPVNIFSFIGSFDRVQAAFDRELTTLDLTPGMASITTPTLIVWGRKDGGIPYAMAGELYAALGTPAADKSVVTLENSAHNGFVEEPAACSAAIANFLRAH